MNTIGKWIATVLTVLVVVLAGMGSAGCLPDSTSPAFGYAVFGPTPQVDTLEAQARARVAVAVKAVAARQEGTRARVARLEAQDQADSTYCEENPIASQCMDRLSRALDRRERSLAAFDHQFLRSLAEPVEGTDIDALIRHWNEAKAEGEEAASLVED